MGYAWPVSDQVPVEGAGFGLPDGGWCYRTGHQTLHQCGAGHAERHLVPCLQLDCLHCATRGATGQHQYTGDTARARANAAYRHLGGALSEDGGGLRMFTFTFPREWSSPVDDGLGVLGLARIRWLRREVAAIVQEWFTAHHGCRVGLMVQLHPTGDEQSVWAPHFHVVLPLVGLTSDGQCVDLPRWYAPEGKEWLDMDRRWYDACAAIATWLGRSAPPKPIWHTKYCASEAQARGNLRYLLRPFPRWAEVVRTAGHMGRYGLMANGSRVEGLDAWRSRCSDVQDAQPEVCPCGAELRMVAAFRSSSRQALCLTAAGVPIRQEEPDILVAFDLFESWHRWDSYARGDLIGFLAPKPEPPKERVYQSWSAGRRTPGQILADDWMARARSPAV